MRHDGPPPHFLTVPSHKTLKAGTLHGVLSEVAQRRSVAMESLAQDL
jgi:hypothetical protein